MQNYIVTNGDGLLIRAQMSTTNPFNVQGKMSNGEGFTVYQTYQVGEYKWGRISDNPGNVKQLYACLTIRNKEFARLDKETLPTHTNAGTWMEALDAWARTAGYSGPRPE